MDRNPYQRILDAMAGGTDSSGALLLGKVTSASPLKVLVGGNTMEADELLCNADLAGDTEVSAKLDGTGSISGGATSISGAASFDVTGKMSRSNAFHVGDQLLLFPIEEAQRYIILCKVVAL